MLFLHSSSDSLSMVVSPTAGIFETRDAGKSNSLSRSSILADLERALSATAKIRGQGESFLFESVGEKKKGGEHVGRYSFVGCNTRAVTGRMPAHPGLCDTAA